MAPTTAAAPLSPEVTEQVSSLKTEAAALFIKKDFGKALDIYDRAAKLLPSDAPDKTDLILKKAGCSMGLKKYKDAVQECGSILESQPTSVAALKTRSKAINKTDSGTSETHITEQRLKKTIAASKGKVDKADKVESKSSKVESKAAKVETKVAKVETTVAKAEPKAASAPAESTRSSTPANNPYFITIQCTHEDQTQLIHASLIVSYAELYSAAKDKFPAAGPFMLKFTDKEGEAITITSRMDIQGHLGEIVAAYSKEHANYPKPSSPLPPMKLQLVSCAKADVPAPPEEEAKALHEQKMASRENGEELDEPWLLRFAKLFSEVTSIDPAAHHENINLGHEMMTKTLETSVSDDAADPMFSTAREHFRGATCATLIQWDDAAGPMFSKAGDHFRDTTCASLIQWGNVHVMTLLAPCSVKQETTSATPHAPRPFNDAAGPMFSKAGDHFRDATCATLIQWGNVHVVKAEKHAQALLRAGKELGKADLDVMLNEYKETEKKINQAIGFKADSWEAIGSLGQLEWERLKAKLGYIVPSPQSLEEPSTEGKTPEQITADSQAALSEASKKALAKLNAKSVKSVQSHLDKANDWFEKALVLAKVTDEAKKKETEEEKKETEEEAVKLTPEEEQQALLASPTGNMLIMHGNVLYEWSQVLAAVANPWKPTLDTAVEKFRTAGASETEIRSALKNHTHCDELDLGPEPEVATPHVHSADGNYCDGEKTELTEAEAKSAASPLAAVVEPAQAEAEAKSAKGLPSLAVKAKKKTEAKTEAK
eukprot:gene13831-19749_t